MTSPTHWRTGPAGFNTVELMTVVMIIGIVLAYALPNFNGYIRHDRVRVAAEAFKSTCLLARERAMATRLRHRVVFDPDSDTYFVERFEGGVWSLASRDTTSLDPGIELEGSAGGDPTNQLVTFEPLGTLDAQDSPASVTFFNTTSDSSTVNIVRTGRMTVRHR